MARPGLAMAMAKAMAMATAMAADAAAVIRPEHAGGADLHENQLFIEKCCFNPILIILEPSNPQKWIRLEILHQKMVSGGPEVKIYVFSWRICYSLGSYCWHPWLGRVKFDSLGGRGGGPLH